MTQIIFFQLTFTIQQSTEVNVPPFPEDGIVKVMGMSNENWYGKVCEGSMSKSAVVLGNKEAGCLDLVAKCVPNNSFLIPYWICANKESIWWN